MNKNTIISISKDYSNYPAGRFLSDGPDNGQRFRDDILSPALRANDKVTVIIDDVEGYGSSFLEEAFGGLVREQKFNKDEIKNKLSIKYDDNAFKMYADMIWDYIESAS